MKKLDQKSLVDIVALTSLQEGMLFHYLKEPGANYYFEQLSLEMSGEIDADRFENAWNIVIQTNEMLRTVFRWEGMENPIQMVLKEHHLQPQYYDFSCWDTEEKKRRLDELKIEDRNNPFDLTDVPFRVYLCKTGSAAFEMVVSYHHILYDGWSNGIILEEFLTAYQYLCAGKELKIPTKTKFKEFVAWLQNTDRSREDAYWSNYLSGFETPTELSIKKRNKGQERTAANFQIRFDKSIKGQIEDFVKVQRITAASLFYCSWGILLQRYNNSDDVVFGTTVSGRPAEAPGIEQMVGLFINTLPLRIQCFPGEKISELLHRINHALEEREAYEITPLVEIIPGGELLDSIVVIENYPLDSRWNREKNRLIINSYSMFESTHYDLTLGIELFDDIAMNFSYREQAFEKADIERLAGHFTRIIQDVMADPGKEISCIEMLSGEEKHQLLHEWNNTEKPYPRDKTIHQLFEEQASKTPDSIAIFGQTIRRVGLVGLSYRKLNEQSDNVAGLLIKKGVLADNIVGIMTERSVEMIIGILGILKSGGAYLPIDPEYPQERIRYMLEDSNARILLVMGESSEKIIVNCQLLIINCKLKTMHPMQAPSHHSNHLAYIIYTSGTTGRAKGVAVTHRGVVNFILWRLKAYGFSETDVTLQLLSYTFDGFGTNFYSGILSGGALVINPETKNMDFYYIREIVKKHGVTNTSLVPGMYDALLECSSKEHLESLRFVVLAGERSSANIIRKSREKVPQAKLYIEYGPTETTITATAHLYVDEANPAIIGKPIANICIYILDYCFKPVPVKVPGELYVGGSGLARGYLNQPELTAEKFDQDLWDYKDVQDKKNKSFSRGAGGRFYKKAPLLYHTGDLGRWLSDGNIEFLGRIDQQVKIRGFRLELEEIERQLTGHEKVKEAVALTKQGHEGNNYLCAYIVLAADLEEKELRAFLAKKLPAYMIPAYFVFLEKIPLTVNGKVDRRALPEPEITVHESHVPPQNELEERLVTIWNEVLAPTTPAGRPGIGIDDNFFKLGGHSLNATKLVLKVHKELNVKIPVNALFENPTIRELAEFIKKAKQDSYIPIGEVEKREYYPLSAAQKRLFVTQYMETEGLGYNVQNLVQLQGKLSKACRERLENTFKEVIHRHETLRTSFEIVADEPVQRIHDDVEFRIQILGDGDHGAGFIKSFVRPFDLSKAPLLRVGLLQTGEETHILITDMHHIIADALSMSIFIQEFIALYRGEELPPLPIQYKEYTLWQNEISRKRAEKEILDQQETYWLKEFEGDIPLLNLPLDFARPAVRQYEGASVHFELDKEKAGLLKKLAAAEDVTLFILFLSLFNVLLAKICDQEDIPVGSPIAGRKHADLQQVMGLYVNMLTLRNQCLGDKSFTFFLKEVKRKTLAAFENQDYTYEELVDKLSARDPSRNALFDVVFVWEDLDIRLDYLEPPGNKTGEERLTLKFLKVEKINAPFDLILTGAESTETMSFIINYSNVLFKRETIEKIAGNFKEVVSEVLNNPGIKLADISVSYDLLEAVPQPLPEEAGDFGF